jgi:hypothetical protein
MRLSRTSMPSTIAYRIGPLLWMTRPHMLVGWRGYSQRAGKSPFARDCVVGLGGLEPPTKRLSAGLARLRSSSDLKTRWISCLDLAVCPLISNAQRVAC